jgi:hypothetical protein
VLLGVNERPGGSEVVRNLGDYRFGGKEDPG